MGRSALIVDKRSLQDVVTQLESTNTFDNICSLCTAISNSEWGKSVKNSRMVVKGISPAKVYQSLTQLRIEFKTKAGRRGRVAGQTVNRTSRAEKLNGNPLISKWKKNWDKTVALDEVPDRVAKIADRASQGSFKAGVVLACMNCHGFEGSGYKSCCSSTCPLLPLNLVIWPKRGDTPTDEAGFGFDESELVNVGGKPEF